MQILGLAKRLMPVSDATMSLWIVATLFAASVQALRFLLQKRLAMSGLTPAAATFARFVHAPFVIAAGLAIWLGVSGQTLPAIGTGFWPYAVAGAISQILATICVVALFARRNFAVGIAFSKITVLFTVAAGFIVLGETVTWADLLAMGVGLIGVLILSVPVTGGWQVFNRASALGLASGVFFSISAVGWFTAYTLQTAAYVNAVGQVELILSMVISWTVLGERFSRRELLAIVLVGVSVIGLVLLQA